MRYQFVFPLLFIAFGLSAQKWEAALKPSRQGPNTVSKVQEHPSVLPPYTTVPGLLHFPDIKVGQGLKLNSRTSASDVLGQGKNVQVFDVEQKPSSSLGRWYALENENNPSYWEHVYMDRLLIQFKPSTPLNHPQVVAFLGRLGLNQILDSSMFPALQQFAEYSFPSPNKGDLLAAIKECKTMDLIEFAEPSPKIVSNTCYPNDPAWNLMGQCWGHYEIHAESLYCYLSQPTNQRLGVIDDAIDYNHPDLVDVVCYGYDYANQDNNPSPDNSLGKHGTHVTGLSSAKINNNIGISGVNNDTVVFAKVTDGFTLYQGGLAFLNSATINAINAFALSPKMKTFNMSFGSYAPNAAQEAALNTAWNNGKLPIAAAGNDFTSSPSYPAAYTNVVAVSAIGKTASGNLTDAWYSNFGNWISVSAPGGDLNTNWGLLSTLPSNTYGYEQGTSMAAPLVTGVAAAIFDANPFLSAAQARSILQSEVIDLGTPGYDVLFGTGMVCAPCAFLEACNQMLPSLSASATTLCQGSSVQLSTQSSFNAIYQWYWNGSPIPNANQATYFASNPGNYYVYVQSLGGCYNYTNTISLSVTPNPTANYQYSVVGNTVSFVNGASNASTYFWNFGDGNSSTQANPIHNYAQSGNYTVTLTVNNNCGSNSISKTVQINTTGLNSMPSTPTFSLHPNPAHVSFNLHCELNTPSQISIQIVNPLGQVVWQKVISTIAGEFDLSIPTKDLASGPYSVLLKTEGSTQVQRLIVQH
jgi:subtilisin family serine protease